MLLPLKAKNSNKNNKKSYSEDWKEVNSIFLYWFFMGSLHEAGMEQLLHWGWESMRGMGI